MILARPILQTSTLSGFFGVGDIYLIRTKKLDVHNYHNALKQRHWTQVFRQKRNNKNEKSRFTGIDDFNHNICI